MVFLIVHEHSVGQTTSTARKILESEFATSGDSQQSSSMDNHPCRQEAKGLQKKEAEERLQGQRTSLVTEAATQTTASQSLSCQCQIS